MTTKNFTIKITEDEEKGFLEIEMPDLGEIQVVTRCQIAEAILRTVPEEVRRVLQTPPPVKPAPGRE